MKKFSFILLFFFFFLSNVNLVHATIVDTWHKLGSNEDYKNIKIEVTFLYSNTTSASNVHLYPFANNSSHSIPSTNTSYCYYTLPQNFEVPYTVSCEYNHYLNTITSKVNGVIIENKEVSVVIDYNTYNASWIYIYPRANVNIDFSLTDSEAPTPTPTPTPIPPTPTPDIGNFLPVPTISPTPPVVPLTPPDADKPFLHEMCFHSIDSKAGAITHNTFKNLGYAYTTTAQNPNDYFGATCNRTSCSSTVYMDIDRLPKTDIYLDTGRVIFASKGTHYFAIDSFHLAFNLNKPYPAPHDVKVRQSTPVDVGGLYPEPFHYVDNLVWNFATKDVEIGESLDSTNELSHITNSLRLDNPSKPYNGAITNSILCLYYWDNNMVEAIPNIPDVNNSGASNSVYNKTVLNNITDLDPVTCPPPKSSFDFGYIWCIITNWLSNWIKYLFVPSSGFSDLKNAYFQKLVWKTDTTNLILAIIQLPVNVLSQYGDAYCVPLQFKIPFLNLQADLPCPRAYLQGIFGDYFAIFDILAVGFVSYNVLLSIAGVIMGAMSSEPEDVTPLKIG